MSLTLVQLATAIEQSKTIEYARKGFVWAECDIQNMTVCEIIFSLRDGDFRIKPEPRQWLIDPSTLVELSSGPFLNNTNLIVVKEVL